MKQQKFDWETPEGNGDALSRQRNLVHYIEQHLPLIASYANKIPLSESASKDLAQANRSGGPRHTAWVSLNQAIAKELWRREKEVYSSAQAVNAQCARAHSSPLYPIQFAADVACLRNGGTANDLNI